MFEKIKDGINAKKTQKAIDYYKKLQQERKDKLIPYFKSVYKNAMVTDELQKWVDEDERRTAEAVKNGEKYWLWNTKEFISKLYFDAVDMCQVFDRYQFLAVYVGIMAKFIEDEEVRNVFKRWYETGEIEYKKEFFGRSIYMIANRLCDHPITALFREYSDKTGQVPYPAYLIIDEIYTADRRTYRNMGVDLKKISDDGLHLVECSRYDYNEATGNHYDNMTDEEKEEYWKQHEKELEERKKDPEVIAKLKACGLI